MRRPRKTTEGFLPRLQGMLAQAPRQRRARNDDQAARAAGRKARLRLARLHVPPIPPPGVVAFTYRTADALTLRPSRDSGSTESRLGLPAGLYAAIWT